MQWDDLRLFLAAWDAGTLTEAARTLGLSQATMSRRLERLESDLGQLLFERSRGGLLATEAARLLQPHVETMAHAVKQANAALQGLEAEPSGTVRLTAVPGVAVDILPLVMAKLSARYPKIVLEVLAENAFRDLTRYEADLALRSQRPEAGSLVAVRAIDVNIGVFASPDYVAKLDAPTLPDLDWIQYGAELAGITPARVVDDYLDGRSPVLRSNNFLVMRAAAQAGLGCIILADVQGELAGLERVPVDLPGSPMASLFLVMPQSLRRVPRIRAVVEVLTEVLNGLV